MTRLLAEPVDVRVDVDGGGVPVRLELPGAGWQQVAAVCARWRVETDWWREPVAREYWKLGLKKESGSGGPEPDILCEVYRDRMVDRWQLARVYD